jgi:SAM-dependent methyltransferase
MHGAGGGFEYAECKERGTLQLLDPPRDMSPYYPSNYYSFTSKPRHVSGLRRIKGRLCMLPGLARLSNHATTRAIFSAGVKPRWRVLDVGCGAGDLLHYLHEVGCPNVTGVDPFLPAESHNGVRLLKRSIFEVDGKWELVMLHHAFEHLFEPEAVLRKIRDLLVSGGRCLIRIPVAAEAWKIYRTRWVQLDAPRHIFLYTERGLRSLAQRCGLTLQTVTYDSTAFQFWASELYKQDVPLDQDRSGSRFSREQIQAWERQADQLNRRHSGDQAAFILSA